MEESLAICSRNDRPPSFEELLEINANFFGSANDPYDILPKYEEVKDLSYIHNAHDWVQGSILLLMEPRENDETWFISQSNEDSMNYSSVEIKSWTL